MKAKIVGAAVLMILASARLYAGVWGPTVVNSAQMAGQHPIITWPFSYCVLEDKISSSNKKFSLGIGFSTGSRFVVSQGLSAYGSLLVVMGVGNFLQFEASYHWLDLSTTAYSAGFFPAGIQYLSSRLNIILNNRFKTEYLHQQAYRLGDVDQAKEYLTYRFYGTSFHADGFMIGDSYFKDIQQGVVIDLSDGKLGAGYHYDSIVRYRIWIGFDKPFFDKLQRSATNDTQRTAITFLMVKAYEVYQAYEHYFQATYTKNIYFSFDLYPFLDLRENYFGAAAEIGFNPIVNVDNCRMSVKAGLGFGSPLTASLGLDFKCYFDVIK